MDDGVGLSCDAHPCTAVEVEARSVQVAPGDLESAALDPLLVPDSTSDGGVGQSVIRDSSDDAADVHSGVLRACRSTARATCVGCCGSWYADAPVAAEATMVRTVVSCIVLVFILCCLRWCDS